MQRRVREKQLLLLLLLVQALVSEKVLLVQTAPCGLLLQASLMRARMQRQLWLS